MSVISKNSALAPGIEPIEGYTLEAKIGEGGYGEVWRANAPGNIKKAVKFVFGSPTESRAVRERKSLERIRGVRHPFLLTLERFEITGNQLIIVTELADGSLEDIYQRHRETGSCGIPRDSLFKHLSDAADALDYLHSEYGLQHLDVKPANLLMIGGHVKVGDFGLLKDLRDVDCSVVGGLTPIYAPPELFDGRPSPHSDQYSLAVMYQELLTGTRPFAGRTIAQLATQHVHSTPNLEPLPPRDRPVIARALEKNPERRFESCCELVEALRSRDKKTFAVAEPKPVEKPAVEVADLPQLGDSVAAEARKKNPTILVVALGGTGFECLSDLRRRVASPHNWRDVQLHGILVDTDMETVHAVRVGELSDRVPNCQAIHTPLKSASDYRRQNPERFATISRRWLYNVPRSRMTEGVRPIGRLAMVDHGKKIADAIDQSVRSLGDPEQIEDLHVFMVGSLAGGTGGGMYLDLVHLLRQSLDESGFQSSEILSLMAIASPRGNSDEALGCHNSHAALLEIGHFLSAGNGYIGDPGAGFPSVPAARTPLRRLYLIAGQRASKHLPCPSSTIANYLWAETIGGGEMLAKARKLVQPKGASPIAQSVRSVGVVPLTNEPGTEQHCLAPAIVNRVLVDWLGSPTRAHAGELSERIARRIGLTPDFVMGSVIRTVTPDTSEDAKLDSIPMINVDAARTDGSLDFIGGSLTNQLHREISITLSDRRFDLATLIEAVNGLHSRCTSLPQSWAKSVAKKNGSPAMVQAIVSLAENAMAPIAEECVFLIQRMECLSAILAVAAVETRHKKGDSDPWDAMPTEIGSCKDEIVRSVHQLAVNENLVRPLNDLNSNLDAPTLIERLSGVALPLVVAKLQEHAEAFEKFSMDPPSGSSTLDQQSTLSGGQTRGCFSATPTGLLGTHRAPGGRASMDCTQAIPSGIAESDGPAELGVDEALAIVRPALSDFGGFRRLVLLVGAVSQRTRLEPRIRELYEGSVSIAVVDGCPPTLIYEAQQIELKSIVARYEVLGGNPQITSRLASRIDIDWQSL
ncbi:MAG: tubulin-like doman-containing protein [Planctomycetota bacterium]